MFRDKIRDRSGGGSKPPFVIEGGDGGWEGFPPLTYVTGETISADKIIGQNTFTEEMQRLGFSMNAVSIEIRSFLSDEPLQVSFTFVIDGSGKDGYPKIIFESDVIAPSELRNALHSLFEAILYDVNGGHKDEHNGFPSGQRLFVKPDYISIEFDDNKSKSADNIYEGLIILADLEK